MKPFFNCAEIGLSDQSGVSVSSDLILTFLP